MIHVYRNEPGSYTPSWSPTTARALQRWFRRGVSCPIEGRNQRNIKVDQAGSQAGETIQATCSRSKNSKASFPPLAPHKLSVPGETSPERRWLISQSIAIWPELLDQRYRSKYA